MKEKLRVLKLKMVFEPSCLFLDRDAKVWSLRISIDREGDLPRQEICRMSDLSHDESLFDYMFDRMKEELRKSLRQIK